MAHLLPKHQETLFGPSPPSHGERNPSFLFSCLLRCGGCDRVHLVRWLLFDQLYQPRMIDDQCEAVGEMKIGSANRSTRKKTARLLLCPPQIPHDLTGDRARASAVMARSTRALNGIVNCQRVCIQPNMKITKEKLN
jgi:hypothetical protein